MTSRSDQAHTDDRTNAGSHLALYPGSFDPITLGHLDVLRRARRLFDTIVLGIGENPDKSTLFSREERLEITQTLVDRLLAEEPAGAPVRVELYHGLTVEFARRIGAVVIIRGIRNITDLAAETQLAITNRQVAEVETVFIVTGEQYAFTSSSLIKQVGALGGDLERLRTLVPDIVIQRMQEKRDDPGNPLGALARDQLVE